MICILAWTFTTLPERHSLTIPLLIVIHFFMGLSTAGVNVGSGNIGLKLAPKGQATAFLAANSIVASLAAGTAPILGGKLVDLLNGYELSMTLKWLTPENSFIIPTLNFQQWDFFFVLAFLIGTYSIHRLALVSEEGEVEEKIIVHELLAEVLRPLRTLTTAGGIQQLIQFPFSLIRNLMRSNKDNCKSQ
jgi:MFS family permease